MRGFLAILVREVAERGLLLAGAIMAGFFPLLVPFLPGVPGASADLRSGIALGLCLTVAAVLAVALGASVIAGELATGRLGFYFARPIAGWAIWAGKLAGAAILSAGAALLVLLPTLVVDHRIELGMPFGRDSAWVSHVTPFLAFLAAGCLLLVLLSHLVSSMVRSRSPWLLLDLGAAFAAVAVFWSIRQALLREGALDPFNWGFGVYSLLLATAAVAASAVQVTRGRTDARRAHRLLSLAFWGGVAFASTAFAVYARWVVNVSPTDLGSIDAVLSAPAGPWVALRGLAIRRGGYFPAFLFNTATGRSLKIGASPNDRFWWLQPVFSPDGSHAAWLEAASSGYDLKTLDLTRPGARPVTTAVSFADWPDQMALSPGGRLRPAVRGHTLTVDDLAARKLVASVPLSAFTESRLEMRFMDDRHLRLFHVVSERSERLARPEQAEQVEKTASGGPVWRLTAFDLEPGHGRLVRVGSIELTDDWILWTIAPDGWHIALRSSKGLLRLADLRTGTVFAALPLDGDGGAATFLADGRLLLDRRISDSTTLELLDSHGAELRRFAFPEPRVALSGELQPGLLAVATSPRGRSDWNSFLLNLDNGQRTPIGQGMIPAVRDLTPLLRNTAGAQSIGTRLFLRAGALVLLDPTTGRQRIVLRFHGG